MISDYITPLLIAKGGLFYDRNLYDEPLDMLYNVVYYYIKFDGRCAMEEKIYTVEEAAERLGVHAETIRRWLRNGELKGIRFKRIWRIKESDLLGKQITPNSCQPWQRVS
jgi:excisionase family DNA binding protein